MLFEAAPIHGRVLRAEEVPLLQALFDANPEYFLQVNDRRPHANEAEIEFAELPPAHLGYSRHWVIGLFDDASELVGVSTVTSDLIVAGTWHIGFFVLATRLHGRGVARSTFAALERWAVESGAKWIRLNVVIGNTRAERFWARCGFVQLRVRERIDTGGRINDLLVLLKPVGSDAVADYLALAPRDMPGSTLA